MNETNNFSQMNNFGISTNINLIKPPQQHQQNYYNQDQSGYNSNFPAVDNRFSQKGDLFGSAGNNECNNIYQQNCFSEINITPNQQQQSIQNE